MKKENRNLVLVISTFLLFMGVLIITPIGGWNENNPYHEDYKLFFVISFMMFFVSVVVAAIDRD